MSNKKKIIIVVVSTIALGVLLGGLYTSNKKAEAKKIVEQKQEQEERQLKKDKDVLKIKKEELKKYEKIEDDSNLMLVNKDKPLKEGYVAKDIVQSGVPFIYGSSNTRLNKDAAEHAREMFNAAKKDGITLLGVSGYRTHYTQTQIYNNNLRTKGREHTEKYSAAPGTSEHETGLAMDIVSSDHKNLTWSFENTKAFKWLSENSYKYGFILRYPKDKVGVTKYEYEPWHYRYVGVKNAEKIEESGLSFDEYVNWSKQNEDRLQDEIKKLEDKLEKNK